MRMWPLESLRFVYCWPPCTRLWLVNLSAPSVHTVYYASITSLTRLNQVFKRGPLTRKSPDRFKFCLLYVTSSQFSDMVWTSAMMHRLRDYSELKEIDVFDEKSLKSHLKFLTLVAKLSKAGLTVSFYFKSRSCITDRAILLYWLGCLFFYIAVSFIHPNSRVIFEVSRFIENDEINILFSAKFSLFNPVIKIFRL